VMIRVMNLVMPHPPGFDPSTSFAWYMKCTELEKEKGRGHQTECEELRESQRASEVAAAGTATAEATEREAMVAAAAAAAAATEAAAAEAEAEAAKTQRYF